MIFFSSSSPCSRRVFRYFRGAYCLHLLVYIDVEVSGEKLALTESGNLERKAVPYRKAPEHRAFTQRTIYWPKPPRKPEQNILFTRMCQGVHILFAYLCKATERAMLA